METATENLTPRIYVACLAAYNSGRLHGAWIDAGQGEDKMREAVARMLKCSPVDGAEEYAIHDCEGFEGVRIEEYAGLSTVAEIAAYLTEHGKLGGAVLAHFCGDLDEARDAIENRYHGSFESLADYMQELGEETGDIPERLRFYIDWQAMARDTELGGDVFTIETGWREVHVFSGG